ncbi:hypothetical protein [Roseibium marinum]|uniref:Uncharacterized protein n=1 Tax=Roseibium marinum TaxID=281252 RepID=A0A2S3UPI7_9HYPH|nr:hypothetical protein [Roseibium marinum]POF29453.1 hypothetical protein CLV41_109230 [Roseibium marinum]
MVDLIRLARYQSAMKSNSAAMKDTCHVPGVSGLRKFAHVFAATVIGLLIAVLFPLEAEATEAECMKQGFSCANLVYQGFTYPYAREDGSYLYVNGGVYPYVDVTGNLLGDSTLRLPDNSVIAAAALLKALGIPVKADDEITPVIGFGSNPAPSQLARKFQVKKFSGDVVIPVMKGTLQDFDVVWTPVFVSYGSMPSTITPSNGTVVDVWVTWLDSEELKVMGNSEYSNTSKRPFYVRTTIAGAKYAFDGPDPDTMQVYISCFGPLKVDGKTYAVKSVPAKGRNFPDATSSEAIEKILPALGWKDSVLDLLYDNVVSPENRAERSTALKPYGSLPDIPGAKGLEACKASRTGNVDPY